MTTLTEQAVENWYGDDRDPDADNLDTAHRPAALPQDWAGTVTVAAGTQVNHAGTTYPAGAIVTMDAAEDRDTATHWIRSGWATPNTTAKTKPAKAGR